MSLAGLPDVAARFGCDATVQFPAHGHLPRADMTGRDPVPGFTGQIYDYEASALTALAAPYSAAPRFPAVMPGWDNTARRMERAAIFDGATPGAFQAWLEEAIRQTRDHNAPGQRFVFVNAWNEWAEGAQVEPDRVQGHARLEAVRNALAAAQRTDGPAP
jgi:lipopolysaccharide biosynthesis protein